MYRPSKRSSSVPKQRKHLPPRRQKDVQDDRPAWDDTQQDLSKYKATPEVIARRREQRVSKNNMQHKRLSLDGAHDQGALLYPPASPQGHLATPGTYSSAGQEGASATSPAIDYGAVLKLLNKPPTPVPSADTGPAPASAARMLLGPAGANDVQRQHDQDAVPAHMSQQQPATEHGVAMAVADGADDVLDATLARLVLPTPLPVSTPQTAAPHAAASAAAPTRAAAEPDLPAQGFLAGMQARQQGLEVQVASLETLVHKLHLEHARTQEQLQGSRSGHGAPDVQQELQQLRQAFSQVREEQTALRAQFEAFSSHAGGLMTQLQAQLLQLLRTAATSSAVTAAADDGQALAGLMSRAQEQLASLPAGLSCSTQQPPAASQLQAAVHSCGLPGPAELGDGMGPVAGRTRPPAAAAAAFVAQTQAPAAGGGGSGPRTSIPVSQFEDCLALPSYAAMRRSTASATKAPAATITTTARPTAAPGPQPHPAAAAAAAPTAGRAHPATYAWQQQSPSGSPTAHTASGMGPYGPSTAAPAAAGDGYHDVMQGVMQGGPPQRTWPAQYQPRALGSGPVLAQGLPSPPIDPASRGLATMPTAAWFGTSEAETIGAAAAGGFRGMASSFGVMPEPMVFNVPSDFKIVRVGGGASAVHVPLHHHVPSGLTPENSLSLAAHTAAALRGRRHAGSGK